MQKSTVLKKNDFECIFDRFEVLVVIILGYVAVYGQGAPCRGFL